MPENRALPPRAKAVYSWQGKAAPAAVATALAALGVWYNWPDARSVILFLAPVFVGLCYVAYRGFPCPRCSRGMWKAKWPGDARGRIWLRCRKCNIVWDTGSQVEQREAPRPWDQ